MLKKILSTILVLSMIFTLSLSLFSCKDEKDNTEQNDQQNQDNTNTTPEKVTYTVTVVDEEGNPIEDVELTFTPKSGQAVPFPTDADGKASYRTDKELTVKVTDIPNGYEYDSLNKALNFDKDGKLTITLKTIAPYVIRVVDQEGNPVKGVRVQMCDEAGSCRMPVSTGENGEAYYPYEEGNFHAQLTIIIPDDATPDVIDQILAENIPGYTVENPGEYYSFDNGVATIVLIKIAE